MEKTFLAFRKLLPAASPSANGKESHSGRGSGNFVPRRRYHIYERFNNASDNLRNYKFDMKIQTILFPHSPIRSKQPWTFTPHDASWPATRLLRLHCIEIGVFY
jgi:hypothetical protein